MTALLMERGRKGSVKITHSLIFLPRESGSKYSAIGSGLYGYFGLKNPGRSQRDGSFGSRPSQSSEYSNRLSHVNFLVSQCI